MKQIPFDVTRIHEPGIVIKTRRGKDVTSIHFFPEAKPFNENILFCEESEIRACFQGGSYYRGASDAPLDLQMFIPSPDSEQDSFIYANTDDRAVIPDTSHLLDPSDIEKGLAVFILDGRQRHAWITGKTERTLLVSLDGEDYSINRSTKEVTKLL